MHKVQLHMARQKVKIKPNAKKSEILNQEADTWHIAVKAPAEDNKANKELVRFLSKKLKKRVRIKSGLKSKTKILEIF